MQRNFCHSIGLMLCLFLAISGCKKDSTLINESEIETKALGLVNDYRVNKELPILVNLPIVYTQAQDHSKNMASGKTSFSHDGSDKRFEIIRETEPSATKFGENVAFNSGHSDPAQVAVDGWIESTGHRENMEGDWTHSGLSAVSNQDGEFYFTQIFVKK